MMEAMDIEENMVHVCCDNSDCENFDVDLFYVDANDWGNCCLDAITIAEEKRRMAAEDQEVQ